MQRVLGKPNISVTRRIKWLFGCCLWRLVRQKQESGGGTSFILITRADDAAVFFSSCLDDDAQSFCGKDARRTTGESMVRSQQSSDQEKTPQPQWLLTTNAGLFQSEIYGVSVTF